MTVCQQKDAHWSFVFYLNLSLWGQYKLNNNLYIPVDTGLNLERK